MARIVHVVPFMLAMVSMPVVAQPAPATTALRVERASDPERAVGWQLPMDAFVASTPRVPGEAERFEIVGVDVADSANRPGRTDERDRVLHHGREVHFFEAGAGAAPLPPPQLRPDWMLAHHIDVGQGNATLLEFSCGVVLVDTGGQVTDQFDGTRRLVEYLGEVFARRPDLQRRIAALYLTHPHKDHTAGVTALLSADPTISIGSVIANGRTNGSGWNEQRRLLRYAAAQNIPVTIVSNESIQRSDGLTSAAIDPLACASVDPDIRVLWGSDSGQHGWTSDANNHSVVVRVDFGESSFLLTGDLEENAQPEFIGSYVRNPDIIDADVYQVGHHGSRNGTTSALLRVITPEIAVIGSGNPADEEPGFSAYGFGHPNRVAIELLSDPSFGVTMSRPPVTVAVGISGRRPGSDVPPRYANQEIARAIFSTGWDGDIVIAASASGQKVVQTR